MLFLRSACIIFRMSYLDTRVNLLFPVVLHITSLFNTNSNNEKQHPDVCVTFLITAFSSQLLKYSSFFAASYHYLQVEYVAWIINQFECYRFSLDTHWSTVVHSNSLYSLYRFSAADYYFIATCSQAIKHRQLIM